ncbi:MAG: acyltransferase family protein [Thermoleophilia bacterium]
MNTQPVRSSERRLGYMPAVDGLRAVAVAAVVVFHLGAAWLPGGFLGVDVFFVISGFLITSLLLTEHRATGTIRLGRFWMRRARRLLPAVFLMMALTLTVMLALHPDEVARLRGQVVAAVFYVINWHFIIVDVPYFEQFGRPSVFLHLWSLAIEEQFYLVWPLALLGLLAVLGRRWIAGLVVVGIAASTLLGWWLWDPFADTNRVYYGTDVRAVALLVGVLLALVLTPRPGFLGSRLRMVVATPGAVGLGLAFALLDEQHSSLYRGGLLAVAVASAAVIAAAADAGTLVARVLRTPVMVWVGLRSYGIYVWHWPVIVLTTPGTDVPIDGAALAVVRVVAILLIAAASYRWVEVPIRRGGMGAVRAGLDRLQRRLGRGWRLAATAAVPVYAAGLVVAVAVVPNAALQPPLGEAAAAPAATAVRASVPAPILIGDSVMLSAQPQLQRRLGADAVIDAEVGRRFAEGAALARAYLRELPDRRDLVIHLGNNYFIRPGEIDRFLAGLDPEVRVVLITVRVPLPWEGSVNRTLAAAGDFPNVSILDWHGQSGDPGLLVDGAHMAPSGARRYADAVAGALESQANAQ